MATWGAILKLQLHMYMLGLALCRGPQVWREIALQLARQTNCTDLQLNIMVMPPLQSKDVTFHFTQVMYLLEGNCISLVYLYKFRGYWHPYKQNEHWMLLYVKENCRNVQDKKKNHQKRANPSNMSTTDYSILFTYSILPASSNH